MQIGPEDGTTNVLDHLYQMMVIAPIDSQENEAKNITEKDRNQRTQGIQIGAVWRPHFKHHDSNDDSKHTNAECLHSSLSHLNSQLTSAFREYSGCCPGPA